MIEKVELINNGLTDESFAYVLTGIRDSEYIRRISCTGNTIGEQSLLHLSSILGRAIADKQFTELTLIRVKIQSCQLNSMLKVISNNCPLQKLGLSKIFFDEIAIDLLAKILSRANSLYSLNLSACEILSIHLNKIITIISKNRNLEYVDLSWLLIGTQGEMTISHLKEEMIAGLLKFIRKNQRLIHLDLSYSRLTDYEFTQIVEVLAKSKTLLVVHATGNGITSTCKAKSLHRLKGVKIGSKLHSIYPDKLKTKMVLDEKYILWRIRENFKVHMNNTWIESEECFVCQKWKYSVFLYSGELATKKYNELIDIPLCNTILNLSHKL